MKRTLSAVLALVVLMSVLFLSGCDLGALKITEEYVITLSENATGGEVEAAKLLQAKFSEAFGMELTVSTDGTAELEIVIGNCDRPEAQAVCDQVGEYGYALFVSGKKLYIYGTDGEYLELAVEAFINDYMTGKKTVSIPSSLNTVYKPETAPAFDPTQLRINGVDIAKYTIVYGADGRNSPFRDNGKWIESGKLEDAANAICDAIYELTNQKLPVVSEKESETDYEIIVGWADRDAADDFYRSGSLTTIEKYGYGLSEGKLLLAGGSSNACYYAGMAFIDACKAMTGSDFTSPIVKGEAELITVACIGDSITDGAGQLDNGDENERNTHSYPIFLQKLLGFKYYVGNYGYSGKMMVDFAKTNNFTKSYEAAPDVVIMMFGTNDCNTSKNPDWGTAKDRKDYENAATAMINRYKASNPEVQVFFMTPPAIIRNTEHQKRCQVVAQYNRDYAAANGLPLVDIFKISDAEQWVFNDGIHPQGEVYKSLAEAIYGEIKDIIVQ